MEKRGSTGTPKYPVLTLEKALKIIEIIYTDSNNDGLGISELSRRLDMGKSTVHRIVDTLVAQGYLDKCSSNTKYRLGWKLFQIGNAVPQQRKLNNFDIEILHDLCDKYQETVNLGIRVDRDVVTIAKVDPATVLTANHKLGAREPIHATAMGKILISELAKDDVIQIFGEGSLQRYTPNTIISTEELILELEKIKIQGYSIDDEEYCVGLTCIAMPVRNYNNEITAAISVSGASIRLNFNKIMDIKSDLGIAVKKYSAHLGYMGK